MEMKKVIKAVEEAFDLVHSDFIGTDDFNETEWEQNKADALSLLKKQEAKPVRVEKNTYNHEFYYCPRCDRSFYETWFKKPKFCDMCGQAVTWE